MTFNQELITKARKGEIAILNDGSVEELRELLRAIWIYDLVKSFGEAKYYAAFNPDGNEWAAFSETNLPAHSVKDFFITDATTDSKSYLAQPTKMTEFIKQWIADQALNIAEQPACAPGTTRIDEKRQIGAIAGLSKGIEIAEGYVAWAAKNGVMWTEDTGKWHLEMGDGYTYTPSELLEKYLKTLEP